MMPDREKVITWLEICGKNRDCSGTCPYGDGSGEYEDRLCREDLMADALALLKERKVPEELKLKIWNALYTKEDEYEKKLIEADKYHEWFSVYRPWLQMGFNIAIDAIADWEGR